ncbi:MAG: glycosyltransferase family 39 protein [Acidobacteria bacterium]|nr:glycosyltransferase family 39 protein [Acidobacteriota bacterium]
MALFACGFTWVTGHKGLFLLDQSMIFDGGWRLLQGEVPYRDFRFPFGPITFYVQELSFRLYGVNWSATVLPAAAFSFIGTLSAIRIVQLLTAGSRALALCSGVATAFVFQAPFGTLWFEQTAMFFNMLALHAVVEAVHMRTRLRAALLFASGFLLVVAVLSKQNFGLFFIPVVVGVVVAGDWGDVRRILRSLLAVAAGGAVCSFGFLLWLWLFSDISAFVEQVLVVGGTIGKTRMTGSVLRKAFFFAIIPGLFQVDLIGVVTAIPWMVGAKRLPGKAIGGMAPLWVTAVLLAWYRSFTQATTYNEWENNVAFMGVSFCLGIAVLARAVALTPVGEHLRGILQTLLVGLVGVWGATVFLYVGSSASGRHVQQFLPGTLFRDSVRVRGMEGLRWGEPTRLGERAVLQRKDFEEVANELNRRGERFFLMGDSAILYALAGVRSPQPLLYFLPQHSFLEREIPGLDETVSSALERNQVRLVVREKATHLPAVHDSYRKFPRMTAWFSGQFVLVREFGNYELWERKRDSQP